MYMPGWRQTLSASIRVRAGRLRGGCAVQALCQGCPCAFPRASPLTHGGRTLGLSEVIPSSGPAESNASGSA